MFTFLPPEFIPSVAKAWGWRIEISTKTKVSRRYSNVLFIRRCIAHPFDKGSDKRWRFRCFDKIWLVEYAPLKIAELIWHVKLKGLWKIQGSLREFFRESEPIVCPGATGYYEETPLRSQNVICFRRDRELRTVPLESKISHGMLRENSNLSCAFYNWRDMGKTSILEFISLFRNLWGSPLRKRPFWRSHVENPPNSMKDQSNALPLCKKVQCENIFPAGKQSTASTVAFSVLALLIVFSLFTACGTKAATDTAAVAPGKSVWSFAPEGIQIQYTADKMLNVFENEPHTLILAVYQLNNINAFNNLTKDIEGLKKLLQVQSFDSSVVGMNKLVVQPGEEKTVVLNRAEDAKWVGIIAGYYSLDPGQVNRLFNIPLITEKKGIYGFRTTESRVGQMTIKLLLGPSALHEREVIVK